MKVRRHWHRCCSTATLIVCGAFVVAACGDDGSRRGISEVDTLLAALETRRMDEIAPLLRFTPTACTTAQEETVARPLCHTEEPYGTLVPVFRETISGRCRIATRATHVRRDETMRLSAVYAVPPLYAVYRYSNWPGAYVAIFAEEFQDPDFSWRAVQVGIEGDAITWSNLHCAKHLSELTDALCGGDYIIQPREDVP